MKILIVEDDSDSRVFLERALKGKGYTVETAVNGIEALDRAGHGPDRDGRQCSDRADYYQPRDKRTGRHAGGRTNYH